MGALAAMRLPAASTPMSAMVTSASASAARAASAAEVDRVDVGALAELRHVDAEDVDVVGGHWVPLSFVCVVLVVRSSDGSCRSIASVDRFEAEADGLGAGLVGAQRSRSRAGPSCRCRTCSGSGSTLIRLPRTLVPAAVDHRGDERAPGCPARRTPRS